MDGMNQDEAVAWLAELLEGFDQPLKPDTLLDANGAWDSLGVLMLMADLEERFDILVESDEMMALKTVDDVLAILRCHGKLAEAGSE